MNIHIYIFLRIYMCIYIYIHIYKYCCVSNQDIYIHIMCESNQEIVVFRSCVRCEAACACGTMLLPRLGRKTLRQRRRAIAVRLGGRALPSLFVASSCFPSLPVASHWFPLLPVASRCFPTAAPRKDSPKGSQKE